MSAMDADDQQSSKPRVIITTARGAAAAAAAAAPAAGNRRVVKQKGRGFQTRFESSQEERYAGKGGEFDSIDEAGASHTEAQKSVEGWIVVVTNLHEESNEDDLYELFADHGDIKQLHLNLDRRTGYVKGYALIEYASFKEAQSAISTLNGHALHEQTIVVDWAFKQAPNARAGGRSGGGGGGRSAGGARGPRTTGRGQRDP